MATDTPITGASSRAPSSQSLAAKVETIDQAASSVQTMANRIRALTLAARWMLEEDSPLYGEAFTKMYGERIMAAEQFIQMIRETAERIGLAGEGIEKAGFGIRRDAGVSAQVSA